MRAGVGGTERANRTMDRHGHCQGRIDVLPMISDLDRCFVLPSAKRELCEAKRLIREQLTQATEENN